MIRKTDLTLALAAALLATGAAAGESFEAITRPSEDRVLSFTRPGLIAEVTVEDGDAVEQGQVLVRLDSAAERIQLAQLEAEAENTTRVEAAEARLAQKRVDLKRLRFAAERGAATELEVETAQLEVKISELSLVLARFELEQAKLKYREAEAQVDRMSLESPIDGRTETVAAEAGEAVEARDRILRVIRIDPLRIDVPVPLDTARKLKVGLQAVVHFEPEISSEGKITFLAGEADAASRTLTVRVEVPNPEERFAGENVRVEFPETDSAEQAKESGERSPAVVSSTISPQSR